MHARNLLVRFVLALLIWSDISSVFAAPPTPPSGFLAWWQFAQYFKNIVEGWLGVGTCPVWQSVIGFNTGASPLYGLPVCQAVASSQWTTNGANIYYNGGNVGIGVSNPNQGFQVVRDGNWTEGNSTFNVFFQNSTRTAWVQFGYNTTNLAGIVWSTNGIDIAFHAWGTEKMRVSSAGNVWIWTSSPWAKLDIGWNVNNNVQATLTRAADSNFALQAINRSAVNAAGALVSSFWVYWWWLDSSSINFYRWGGAQDGKIALSTNGADRLFVENNGNVGIGTSSPWQKLSVAGSIESTTGGFKFPDGTTQTTASVPSNWYNGWVTSPGYDANTIGASKSWFSYSNNAAHTWPLVHFDAGWYWLQLSADYSGGGEGMSFRTRNGDSGTWNGWNRLITTENGMDLTSNQNPTWIKYFQWNKWASSYLGANNTYPLEAYSSDGWAAAMSFHRGWAYAINMWLDPDNVFRIGWWSAGSNRLQLDMAGNLYSASSMRSSVFYDQDNTAYYTDPASTSVLNALRFNNVDCINGNCPSNGAIRLTPNLHLNAGGWYAVIVNWDNGTTGWSQAFRIGNGAGSDVFYVLANGSTYAYNYYYLSDRSLKKDIAPVTGALDKIKKLQGVNFLWKKDDAKWLWFIAQDVEKVFPEVVSTDKNTGLKSVQYWNLISPAIESIKELSDKSDAQDKEIQELKKQIAELKEIISHK
jgi:trimeric autotransporter adhesin